METPTVFRKVTLFRLINIWFYIKKLPAQRSGAGKFRK